MSNRNIILAAAGGAPSGPVDPFFNQTTLLLHGDGTNGAQNNTFLDSSSNNFTITRNGNTTQGTFTPFSAELGKWSVLAVPNGSNSINTGYTGLSGTGDYSCSFWIYLNSWTGGDNNGADGGFVYICSQGASHPTYPLAIVISKAGKVVVGDSANFGASWYSTFNSAGSYNTANSIGLNSWNYIHVVRSSGTLSIYANGNLQFSTSQSNSTPAPITNLTINNGNGFDGYISNFRFVTAAITDATPPALPLSTSTSNQVVLTCYGNRFADFNTATTAKTVTAAGSVSVQPFSPFLPSAEYDPSVNGGSGYFDGSGDYLSVATSTDFDLASTTFSIEFWVYFNPASFSSTTEYNLLERTNGSGNGFGIYKFGTNGNANCFDFYFGNYSLSQTTQTVPGQWYHIAVSRDNSTGRASFFINGIRVATSTSATGVDYTNQPLYIATRNGTASIPGYMTGVRIIKGAFAYDPASTTLTVPTSPVTAITDTKFLANFTNAGIFDNTGKNNLETVGNAQIDTATKKYGTGSMEFDGTGDWLKVPNSVNLQLGTGDFTIEFWVYLATGDIGSARGLVAKGGASTGWLVSLDSSEKVVFTYTTSTITSSGAITTNAWNHIAVVREGTGSNETKIYIGGTNDGTGTVSTDFNQTEVMYVGANRAAGDPMKGFIDDLRITKGVARYTSAFTPPTAAFPDL